jgi:predicted enzyme related to lactoylglutathione lyase
MSRVIHFEVPADDTARARTFYERVFGWTFQAWEGPMEYWLVTTGPEGQPGIDGGLSPRQQAGQGPVTVVGVPSIDDTIHAVEAAGGRIVLPKTPIPGVGWVAYFLDTEQNTIGAMQADPGVSAA